MIYLIRHAQKENNTVHATLTKKGLTDSFLYGQLLKNKNININLIVSSPIERCLQTAEQISLGYGKIEIQQSTLLGDPGIFVHNGDRAMEVFNSHSLLDIINKQLCNTQLSGFNDIDSATQKLLLFMKKKKENILYISHDAIITPFIMSIKKRTKIEEDDIVDYLEGYFTSKKSFFWTKLDNRI